MTRKSFLIIIVVVIVAGLVFYFSKRQTTAPTINGSPTSSPGGASPSPSPTPRPSPTTTTTSSPAAARTSPAVARTPQTFMISFLSDGSLSVSFLTIKVGDQVTFINNDSKPHWPVTGIHPTHDICPGFDSGHGLQTGESYSRTFTVAKTCPFHDHLAPSVSAIKGQIIVSP